MSHRPQNPRRMQNHQNHHHQHHNNNHRSARLQKFLNNPSTFQLSETDGFVCEFAEDRSGSKFIQRKLDEATDHRKNRIFEEICANLHILMFHGFANFVVQKFFVIGNVDQRNRLYDYIKEHFLVLSLNKYGCRVVQKAIDKATIHQLACLMEKFTEENIMCLVYDANGNHVIQHIFRTATNVEYRHIQDVLFQCIQGNVIEMCYHLYGCRVIQCVLEHGSGRHRDNIFVQISNNLEAVIFNRYGNYVVQNLAVHCSPPHQNRLIQFVLERVIRFSTNKYASNVVETCIRLAQQEQRYRTMQTICDLNGVQLHQFCTDATANYVVQKLIEVANQEHIEILFIKLLPYFNVMQRYVCGRKIIDKLKLHRNCRIDNHLAAELEALWM